MASVHMLKTAIHQHLTIPGKAMIEFECKHCHEPIRLSDDKAGVSGQCPHCQAIVKAPRQSTLSLHDDSFAEALIAPSPALPVAKNAPAPHLGEKAMSLVGNAFSWFFGVLFLIFALTSITTSLAGALSALAGAALLLPPVYGRLTAPFRVKPEVQIRVVGVVVLFIAYVVMFSSASTKEFEAKTQQDKQQAQAKIQSEREQNLQFLTTNKVSILDESNKLLDQGKDADALTVVKRFHGLGDKDIDALFAKVDLKNQAIANKKKESKLLEALATVKPEDTKERARIYEQLTALAPENADYKKQSVALNAQRAQIVAKEQAESKAAAELAYNREMGLLWRYDTYNDEMTQKAVRTAKVDSTNTLSFGFPYTGSQRATLELRKHPRWGSDVILKIERGQFLCSTYNGCSVNVRFGSGKPQRFSAAEPSDNSTTYLFISDYNRFVSQLRKVDKVVIEANFYQEGSRPMTFSTSDLDWK